jgi:hypothetical protein
VEHEYYILWFRLDEKDSYLIWFSMEDSDGVFLDKSKFVPIFRNIQSLQTYCEKHKISIKIDEPLLHNLDLVQKWLTNSDNKIENYNPFLKAWNLFDDIAKSTNGNFDQDKDLTNNIYNKIFWGCNIPVITPEGKSFTPTWTKKELKIIRDKFTRGFQMFRENIKEQ